MSIQIILINPINASILLGLISIWLLFEEDIKTLIKEVSV